MVEFLRKFNFPKGRIIYRRKELEYSDLIKIIKPRILIEDDCESIGGIKEMIITHLNPEQKTKLISVIVKEFEGIDHLPSIIHDFINK